jgi:hypothetical protein
MKIKRSNFIRPIAAALVLSLSALAQTAIAQVLSEVNKEVCVSGDCEGGRGRLELTTPFGKGLYSGNFRDSEFHGQGRLEIPISFTEKTIYTGNWDQSIRSGRGTFWNGKGNLYIGQWRDDKRNGRGSYFINLPGWKENEHSELWLTEHTENYSGEFVDDRYQGQGTYRWAAGGKYVGGFFANSKHGPGTYYYATGSGRTQLWEYGDFVR